MKLAVIFPGIGYTCKRPLLYYSASMAEELGYEVLRLDYGEDIHSFRGRDASDLKKIAASALRRSMTVLRKKDLSGYEDIVMISKSIGTLIAVKAADRLRIQARHFMITPIPDTIPWIRKTDCVFLSGTGDPYIPKETVLKAAAENPQKAMKIFKECNHSLERPGDTAGNLKNLKKTVKLLKKYLKSE